MKKKILHALFALIFLSITNQASAYYSPSTGRWLSRDPMGEPGFELLRSASAVPRMGQMAVTASLPPSRIFVRDAAGQEQFHANVGSGPNPYNCVANNPLIKIDRLGLNTSDGADGQNLSGDQHNTYLIFHISCGQGKMPVSITIDYHASDMWNDMYSAFPSGLTEKNYESWIINAFNATPGNGGGWGSGFGNSTPRNDPPSGLCSGGQIEIDADMRTRFVSPGWGLGLWREGYSIDPDQMLSIYKKNVRVEYTCGACQCSLPKTK